VCPVLLHPDGITAADRSTSHHRGIEANVGVIMLPAVRRMPGSFARSPWGSVVITQRGQGPVRLRRTASPMASVPPIPGSPPLAAVKRRADPRSAGGSNLRHRRMRSVSAAGEVCNAVKTTGRLRGRVRVPMLALPSRGLIILGLERRGQSRVSPTSQRRRGVPCKRLIRDSAGLAALALVNQMAANCLGMEAGAPTATP
jgi:hypothetical protein